MSEILKIWTNDTMKRTLQNIVTEKTITNNAISHRLWKKMWNISGFLVIRKIYTSHLTSEDVDGQANPQFCVKKVWTWNNIPESQFVV